VKHVNVTMKTTTKTSKKDFTVTNLVFAEICTLSLLWSLTYTWF